MTSAKRKKQLKQAGVILLSLLLSAVLGTGGINAAPTTAIDWYCKNNDTHTQPTLDEGLKIIQQYDGYYVDTKAGDDKVIYLTFDAGYENGNVEKILDALDKHGVKGTFFVLENLIRRNPELVKRMAEGGHTVANHTKTHPDMTKVTDKALFSKQLEGLAEQYRELTGQDMAKIYRPPQGRFSQQNLEYAKELGYKTLFWSFAYADWDNNRQPDPEAALNKILAHLHPGEVMLLHPTSATNAAIMDRLLTEIEAQGYRIGGIGECLS